MKPKLKTNVQQPLIVVLLFIVMLVSLWLVLIFMPQPEQEQERVPTGVNDVRSGEQEISVSVVNGEETDVNVDSPSGRIEITDMDESFGTESDDLRVAGEADPNNFGNRFMASFPAGENVKFRIDRFQKLATQPLKFEVFDNSGSALTPDYLESIQGEKMHFYLVHANLREFNHMIPVFQNNVWNVSIRMPTVGTYYAYIVMDPLNGSPIVYKYDLVVREESAVDAAQPDPTANLEFFDGTRTAKMDMSNLETGRMFSFDLTQDGEALNPEPYLESYGQMSLFKHGDADFFATTPSNIERNENNKIYFTTGNLTPGRYTAFGEFKIAGRVFVFPMTFDIGEI